MDAPPLKSRAAICLQHFATICARLRNAPTSLRDQLPPRVLEDEYERFQVWSGNLGALQTGHASLDWRLRDAETMASSVREVLDILADHLDNCRAILTQERLPYEQQTADEDDLFSSDSDSSDDGKNSTGELANRVNAIVTTMKNLYKLSFSIRRPGAKLVPRRAALYKELVPGTEPGTVIDIVESYEPFDCDHVIDMLLDLRGLHSKENEQPTDEELSVRKLAIQVIREEPLVNRLVQSITKRRRQFKYWAKHRQKLAQNAASAEPPSAILPVATTVQNRRPEAPTMKKPTFSGGALTQSEAPLTATEATKYLPLPLYQDDAVSVLSAASTARDIEGHEAILPDPPETHGREFECPYCFVLCPAKDATRRRWRKHLLEDLQPYMCTYATCKLSDHLFSSRAEWTYHEESYHRQAWRCRDHREAMFTSPTAYQDHLSKAHSDLKPDQVEAVMELSATTIEDVREHCPVCLIPVVDLKRGQTLLKHLANHLERIASFAFPRTTEEGAADSMKAPSNPTVGSQALSESDSETYSVIQEDLRVAKVLYQACLDGSLDFIEELLLDTAPVNYQGGELGTALQAAAFAGRDDVIELLLRNGADIRIARGSHGTALQAASYAGHESTVRLLMREGADVNARRESSLESTDNPSDVFGPSGPAPSGVSSYDTALASASAQGHVQVIDILLQWGASFSELGHEEAKIALFAASGNGHVAAVKRLLEANAHLNRDGALEQDQRTMDVSRAPKFSWCLGSAARNGHLEVIKLLLQAGADPNLQNGYAGTMPLELASQFGHEDIVRTLVDAGAAADVQLENYSTALQMASAEGFLPIVKILVEAGADIEASGGQIGSACQENARTEHTSVMKCLRGFGFKLPKENAPEFGTALHGAATEGHHDIVEYLIKRGADVNRVGGPLGSVLHAAVIRGHMAVVTLLIESGADVLEKGFLFDDGFQAAAFTRHSDIMIGLLLEKTIHSLRCYPEGHFGSALHIACARGNYPAVLLLLKGGAGVNGVGGDLGTPLIAAASLGHANVVSRLITSGANLTLRSDRVKHSALGAAATNGHQEVVKILLERGTDPSVRSVWKDGHALTAAVVNGHTDVVEQLLKFGLFDVNPKGVKYRFAIKAAAEAGHMETALRLYQHGLEKDPSFRDSYPSLKDLLESPNDPPFVGDTMDGSTPDAGQMATSFQMEDYSNNYDSGFGETQYSHALDASKTAQKLPTADLDRTLGTLVPLNFLVIDEKQLNRRILIDMFGDLGYKDFTDTNSGSYAVEVIKAEHLKGQPFQVVFVGVGPLGNSTKLLDYIIANTITEILPAVVTVKPSEISGTFEHSFKEGDSIQSLKRPYSADGLQQLIIQMFWNDAEQRTSRVLSTSAEESAQTTSDSSARSERETVLLQASKVMKKAVYLDNEGSYALALQVYCEGVDLLQKGQGLTRDTDEKDVQNIILAQYRDRIEQLRSVPQVMAAQELQLKLNDVMEESGIDVFSEEDAEKVISGARELEWPDPPSSAPEILPVPPIRQSKGNEDTQPSDKELNFDVAPQSPPSRFGAESQRVYQESEREGVSRSALEADYDDLEKFFAKENEQFEKERVEPEVESERGQGRSGIDPASSPVIGEAPGSASSNDAIREIYPPFDPNNIVSKGISTCQGLLLYYDDYRSDEAMIGHTYEIIRILNRSLTLLKDTIDSGTLDLATKKRVHRCVQSSQHSLEELEKKRTAIERSPERTMGPQPYPFRQTTLEALRNLASGAAHQLKHAVEMMSIDGRSSIADVNPVSSSVIGDDAPATTSSKDAKSEFNTPFDFKDVICDLKGKMQFGYSSGLSAQNFGNSFGVQIFVLRKAETPTRPVDKASGRFEPIGAVRETVSIWTFGDSRRHLDNSVHLTLPPNEDTIPYVSVLAPNEVHIPEPGVKWEASAKKNRLPGNVSNLKIRYVFETEQASVEFQSAVFGRDLLYRTDAVRVTAASSSILLDRTVIARDEAIRVWRDPWENSMFFLLRVSSRFGGGWAHWRVDASTPRNFIRVEGAASARLNDIEVVADSQEISTKNRRMRGLRIEFKTSEERARFIGIVSSEQDRDYTTLAAISPPGRTARVPLTRLRRMSISSMTRSRSSSPTGSISGETSSPTGSMPGGDKGPLRF